MSTSSERSLLRRITETHAPAATVLIRLAVGSIFLSEGIQKFLFPAEQGVGRFVEIGLPAPEILAPFVGVVEIGCGLLVLAGLATRLAAVPLVIDMLVAIATTKIPILIHRGFWATAHEARTDLAMLLGALFLALSGAGPLVARREAEDRRMIRHPYPLLVLSFIALVGCRPAPSKGDAADAGPAAPAPRYGDAMSELGRRFELVGRAAAAGRFELARYELGEIDEIFDDDLPHAASPRVGSNVNLAGVAQAFAETNLPELRRAAEARDRAGFAAAFKRASAVCNGCHAASGHAFIEIPGELGATVPRLDPLPGAPDAGPM